MDTMFYQGTNSLQDATKELTKEETDVKDDETAVYDSFPKEEVDGTEEAEEDAGIPDAAAAEDSEDE